MAYSAVIEMQFEAEIRAGHTLIKQQKLRKLLTIYRLI